MDVDDFHPTRFDRPVDDILPDRTPDIAIETAQHECGKTVGRLTSDVSGIGPKAAERYLLRTEYGFGSETLTQYFDIAPSTLSNQVNQVHRKILRFPQLARILGQFRSKRTGLTEPESSERTLWEGTLDLHSREIYAAVDYRPGGPTTTPYSWKIDLTADLPLNDTTRRLRYSYLVDELHGVVLKRILKGISNDNQYAQFQYQKLRTLEIFPLPHPLIPNEDGTLLSALAHHVSYDIIRGFENSDWSSIEKMINFDGVRDSSYQSLPTDALPETVTGKRTTGEQLRKYTEEVHRRTNLEHLLLTYPFTRIEHIPRETIEVLWIGPIATGEDHLDAFLQTTEPKYYPGSHRTVWALS